MWGRDMDSLPFAPSLYWVWVLFWKAQHIYLFSAGRWRGYSFNFYFYFFSLSKRGCFCWRIHNQMAPWSHVPRFKSPSLSLSSCFPPPNSNSTCQWTREVLYLNFDRYFLFFLFSPIFFFHSFKKKIKIKIKWR